MVPITRRGRTPALLAAALLLATASAGGRGRPDPLNSRAEVPALRHDSALAGPAVEVQIRKPGAGHEHH